MSAKNDPSGLEIFRSASVRSAKDVPLKVQKAVQEALKPYLSYYPALGQFPNTRGTVIIGQEAPRETWHSQVHMTLKEFDGLPISELQSD